MSWSTCIGPIEGVRALRLAGEGRMLLVFVEEAIAGHVRLREGREGREGASACGDDAGGLPSGRGGGGARRVPRSQ